MKITNVSLTGGRNYESDVSDAQQNPDLWVMGGGVIEKELKINGTLIASGNVVFGSSVPAADDVLTYSGSSWIPAALPVSRSPQYKTPINLPDANITAFTPVNHALYMNLAYTANRTLTVTAASLASLNMSPGDVLTFFLTTGGWDIIFSPAYNVTANGVTGDVQNSGSLGYAVSLGQQVYCTGVGTYLLIATYF
jgi:hypothetical protein